MYHVPCRQESLSTHVRRVSIYVCIHPAIIRSRDARDLFLRRRRDTKLTLQRNDSSRYEGRSREKGARSRKFLRASRDAPSSSSDWLPPFSLARATGATRYSLHTLTRRASKSKSKWKFIPFFFSHPLSVSLFFVRIERSRMMIREFVFSHRRFLRYAHLYSRDVTKVGECYSTGVRGKNPEYLTE